MTLATKDDLDLVWQLTQHAMLVPWGRFARHLQLSERLRAAVKIKRYQDATPVYTMAHNGQTTQALRKQIPPDAVWTKVGRRTEALDMAHQHLGQCPYPVRLTLLRWSSDDSFKYSTLISFSQTEPLPLAELFPTYHQRQDVEAGIKQGKGTFSFTKLHVRSPAGIALLGQFALFFWPNFVHWATDWLADQVQSGADRLQPLWPRVRTQVRVAANTPAIVLTSPQGQWLQFDADGPLAGVELSLDGPFHYQLPLPLYQTWPQLWPISSASVKDQLATIEQARWRGEEEVRWINALSPVSISISNLVGYRLFLRRQTV